MLVTNHRCNIVCIEHMNFEGNWSSPLPDLNYLSRIYITDCQSAGGEKPMVHTLMSHWAIYLFLLWAAGMLVVNLCLRRRSASQPTGLRSVSRRAKQEQ